MPGQPKNLHTEVTEVVWDALAHYHFAGRDNTTTPNITYVFFEDKDGAWYILRFNRSTGNGDYAVGSSGLAAAKANPAGQSYGDFSTKF